MAEDDFYTTREAERVLARSDKPLSERRIRQMLQAGELEGYQDDTTGRWYVAQREITRLKEEQSSAEQDPQTPSEAFEMVSELIEEVRGLERAVGRLEGRLKLSEQAESTIKEERDRLIAELADEQSERHRLQLELEAVLERERMHSRAWWRRLFLR